MSKKLDQEQEACKGSSSVDKQFQELNVEMETGVDPFGADP